MHLRAWSLAAPIACGGCLMPLPGDSAQGTTTTATSTGDESSTSTSGSTTTTGEESDAEAGTANPDPHTATSAHSTTDDPACGDGQVDPGEQCDAGLAGNANDSMCLENCRLARCGDGHRFPPKEECDDSNDVPTDGCHECGRTRRVFVTSDTYQADQFMGLVGVDQRCRSLAAQAELPNFATYKAWISDSTTSPAQRMHRGRGRYELVNGLLVADDWDDLLTNGPKIPIVVDQTSQTHETGVWTGTNPDGTAAEGSDHCADWTSQNFGHTGFWGVNTEITADWTLADVDSNPSDCGLPRALLCFEQE